MLEPSLADAEPGSRWQLERVGYFVVDTEDSRPGAPVLNRIVTLRDSWHGPGRGTPTAEPRADATGREVGQGQDPSRQAEPGRVPGRGPPARAGAGRPVRRVAGRARDLRGRRRPAHRRPWPPATCSRPPSPPAPRRRRWPAGSSTSFRPRWATASWPTSPITGAGSAALVAAVESGAITGAAAKEVFAEMVERGGDPEQIIAERGLGPGERRGGDRRHRRRGRRRQPGQGRPRTGTARRPLFGFFVGQVIRASQGKANPQVVQKLLAERLR